MRVGAAAALRAATVMASSVSAQAGVVETADAKPGSAVEQRGKRVHAQSDSGPINASMFAQPAR